MHPLVSVIVPVYNMEEFLSETLASIVASSYAELEIVVMDDGSTDASSRIIQDWAARDPRIVPLHQSNAGVCRARNVAIRQSRGKYVLPVDADNRISPTFIATAVAALESQPTLKVVAPTAERFGDRSGRWELPPFSLSLLARRNLIDTCALYRRSDFDRVGGYCEEIIAREDWEFWIALLKDGGSVLRLPEVGLYYRVRRQSKRIRDRKLNAHVIRVLNQRHPDFFRRELGGPLRRMRSWSRWINALSRCFGSVR